jgi:hypothetical protein
MVPDRLPRRLLQINEETQDHSFRCFYKTDLDIENNKDILIGSVMAKIHGEDSRTQPVFVDLDEIRNGGPQSWWQLFKNTFSCRAPKERQACYIMTIGVIDEVRKLGIGTRLL